MGLILHRYMDAGRLPSDGPRAVLPVTVSGCWTVERQPGQLFLIVGLFLLLGLLLCHMEMFGGVQIISSAKWRWLYCIKPSQSNNCKLSSLRLLLSKFVCNNRHRHVYGLLFSNKLQCCYPQVLIHRSFCIWQILCTKLSIVYMLDYLCYRIRIHRTNLLYMRPRTGHQLVSKKLYWSSPRRLRTKYKCPSNQYIPETWFQKMPIIWKCGMEQQYIAASWQRQWNEGHMWDGVPASFLFNASINVQQKRCQGSKFHVYIVDFPSRTLYRT